MLFLNFIGVSIVYHSALYGYSAPTWGWPLIIIPLSIVGLRIRLSLAQDRKSSFRELTFLGIRLKKRTFHSIYFKGFDIRCTNIVKGQYYYVLNCEDGDTAIHYSKLSANKVANLEHLFAILLGFNGKAGSNNDEE